MRTKRRIEEDREAQDRCWQVIRTALDGFNGRKDASTIADRIHSSPAWWAKIKDDAKLARMLLIEGLKIEIRDALAEWGFTNGDGEGPPQLSLFPDDERPVVKQIGMARIWLPRQDEHVQYHNLPPEDLEDSAAYYAALSRGNARTARLLRQLAKIRRSKPPHKVAA